MSKAATGAILHYLSNRLLGSFSRTIADAGISPTMAISETRLALETSALLRPMHYEPIYGKDGMLGWEGLGRPRAEGRDFSIQRTSDVLVGFEKEELLDLLSLANVIHGAGDSAITVNISVNSILSKEFWKKAKKIIGDFDPSKLIFEILEHPVEDVHADISHLIALKKKGFRFALDDINIGEDHRRRAKLFAPITDFIKLDGPLVCSMLKNDPQGLADLVYDIKRIRPHVQVIAEFVQNFDEAKSLFAMGVDGVQGRYLKKEEYKTKILDARAPKSSNDSEFGVPTDFGQEIPALAVA